MAFGCRGARLGARGANPSLGLLVGDPHDVAAPEAELV